MSENGYEWVKATVDACTGQVQFTYRVKGLAVDGAHDHDEDVSSWSDSDIQELGCLMLDVPDSDKETIEVIWD